MPQKAPNSDPSSNPLSKDKGEDIAKLSAARAESQIDDIGESEGDEFMGVLDTGTDGVDIDSEIPVAEPAKPVGTNLRKLHQEIGADGKPVEKHKRNIYISKQTVEAINELSKARNVTGSKVVELAIALFYKNYFEREFIQISDLELFVEELSVLVGEQSEEISHLSELATRVLDAEMELPTDID